MTEEVDSGTNIDECAKKDKEAPFDPYRESLRRHGEQRITGSEFRQQGHLDGMESSLKKLPNALTVGSNVFLMKTTYELDVQSATPSTHTWNHANLPSPQLAVFALGPREKLPRYATASHHSPFLHPHPRIPHAPPALILAS